MVNFFVEDFTIFFVPYVDEIMMKLVTYIEKLILKYCVLC